MMLAKVAFRNIMRHLRRSLMTASTIAVGAVSLILFGEFMEFIVKGVEIEMVANGGHLSVFKRGYFDYGAGNPSAYSISGYRDVMTSIMTDPELKPMLRVVTPTVSLYGIAGNFDLDMSKTFYGVGVVPSDHERMTHWDDYNIYAQSPLLDRDYFHYGLKDGDENHGMIGVGLARMLGLCMRLKAGNCPSSPPDETPRMAEPTAIHADIARLTAKERHSAPNATGEPRIDLLASTANGAPNVVALFVRSAQPQGFKELDDMYVGMDIVLAQRLLYGRHERKAVSIVLQLNHTADVEKARARLNALFKTRHLDLEVRDFTELQPQYKQILGLFGAIYMFISVVMAIIVMVTVINTMSMSVLERVCEIGTMRAMGMRRNGIRSLFLLEGWMLGFLGAGAGVLLSMAIGYWFNRAGFTWFPPGQAQAVPLLLMTNGVWTMKAAVWLALMMLATAAAVMPAARAARMVVVDALRHV
jgi:putative ABC transport system permease protein